MIPPERISRFLSFVLRHRPEDYPLPFDRGGFAPWDEVVGMVRKRFADAEEKEILGIVEGSDKKRFELKEGKVRATYGHSFPVELEAAPPPERLYHGTARDLAEAAMRDGLKPRGRQYVHLSPSLDEAIAVGQRRDPAPAILVVDAARAHAGGVPFYPSGPLYLAGEIPPEFLALRRE